MCWGYSESFQIYGSMNIVFPICTGVILTFISAVSLPICVGVIPTSYNGSFDIVGLPYTYVWELFYYPTFICPCLNVFPICVGVILKY